MQNTVYIIVDGAMDERHICAVFSTRQAAEAALCYADEGAAIEVFAVDAPLPAVPAGRSQWAVSEFGGPLAVRISAFRFPVVEHVYDPGDDHIAYVWATNEQEALRLGIERIKQYKAGKGK